MAASCAPAGALAHSPIAGLNHFYNGVLHPALVPAHALAIAALSLYCTGLQAEQLRRTLAAFLIGTAAGLIIGHTLRLEMGADKVLLAGAGLAGLLVAAAARSAGPWLSALALALGTCLGVDSAPDQGLEALDAALLLVGQAVGVALLASFAIWCAGSLASRAWQPIARRVLGSWIAACALMVLALGLVQPAGRAPVAGASAAAGHEAPGLQGPGLPREPAAVAALSPACRGLKPAGGAAASCRSSAGPPASAPRSPAPAPG